MEWRKQRVHFGPALFLVCVPNAGIMDAWYPVLAQLKREVEGLRIFLVFPNRVKLLRLNAEDAIAQLSGSVSDGSIFLGHNQRLYFESGIAAAQRLAKRQKVAKKFGITPLLDPRSIKAFIRWNMLRKSFSIRETAICYSLKSRHKLPNRQFLDENFPGPRFSISHGMKRTAALEELSQRIDVTDVSRHADESDVAVYLFAESEVKSYVHAFGVPRDRIHVTGVPRLDPYSREMYPALSPQHPARSCVLLISRRASSRGDQPTSVDDFLPLGAKAAEIRTVLEMCRDLGLYLLIRPHPSEDPSEVINALPPETRGVDWDITDAHPQQLATSISFAVSFYSSVPVELLTLGVPSIEFRVVGSTLVTPEEAFELVVVARSHEDFFQRASEIIQDRDETVKALRRNLYELYAPAEGAVGLISSHIALRLRSPIGLCAGSAKVSGH